MPMAIPPSFRAVLIGQSPTIEDLGVFAPLEESSDEGALFLMRLDFAEMPAAESLNELEQALHEAGVEMWPGYDHVVYAEEAEPVVYLAWMKGFAWLPIIIGIVVTVALPALLGSLVWWLMPADLKSLITNIVNMGVLLLVMLLMSKVMPSFGGGDKKKVKEGSKKTERITEGSSEPVSS